MGIDSSVNRFHTLTELRDAAAEREDDAECERLAHEWAELAESNPEAYDRFRVSLMDERPRTFESHNPNPVRLLPSCSASIGRAWQPKNPNAWKALN